MRRVVIYPGRFQPMLDHHLQVIKHLREHFSDAQVFAATSDCIHERAVLSYQDKLSIAQVLGVDLLKVSKPYHLDSYPMFDHNNTLLIFAVGQKDQDRFPQSSTVSLKKNGDAAYIQSINTLADGEKPMSQRAYVYVVPNVTQDGVIAEASQFRQELAESDRYEVLNKWYPSCSANDKASIAEIIRKIHE